MFSIASKFFLKLLVTIPVAPLIIGTIVHFRFHIRCISIIIIIIIIIIIFKCTLDLQSGFLCLGFPIKILYPIYFSYYKV